MSAGTVAAFSFRPRRLLLVLLAAVLSGGLFPLFESFGTGLVTFFLFMVAVAASCTLGVIGCSDAWSSRLRGGGVAILAGLLLFGSTSGSWRAGRRADGPW